MFGLSKQEAKHLSHDASWAQFIPAIEPIREERETVRKVATSEGMWLDDLVIPPTLQLCLSLHMHTNEHTCAYSHTYTYTQGDTQACTYT